MSPQLSGSHRKTYDRLFRQGMVLRLAEDVFLVSCQDPPGRTRPHVKMRRTPTQSLRIGK